MLLRRHLTSLWHRLTLLHWTVTGISARRLRLTALIAFFQH